MGSPVLATVGPPTWKPPEPDPDQPPGATIYVPYAPAFGGRSAKRANGGRALRPNRGLLTVADAGKRLEESLSSAQDALERRKRVVHAYRAPRFGGVRRLCAVVARRLPASPGFAMRATGTPAPLAPRAAYLPDASEAY